MATSEYSEKRIDQDQDQDDDTTAIATDLTATEVGSYVRDLAHGMRQVTQGIDQKDIRFLDYLLAILEGEALKIAEHSYH